jgi:hypothetical protein
MPMIAIGGLVTRFRQQKHCEVYTRAIANEGMVSCKAIVLSRFGYTEPGILLECTADVAPDVRGKTFRPLESSS